MATTYCCWAWQGLQHTLSLQVRQILTALAFMCLSVSSSNLRAGSRTRHLPLATASQIMPYDICKVRVDFITIYASWQSAFYTHSVCRFCLWCDSCLRMLTNSSPAIAEVLDAMT